MDVKRAGVLILAALACLPLAGCMPSKTSASEARTKAGPTVRPLRDASVTVTATPTPTPLPTAPPDTEVYITPQAYGVYMDETVAAVFAVVLNPSQTRRLERIRVVMTIYDTNGAALTRAGAGWSMLMPGERQAFTANLTGVPKDRKAGKIDFDFGIGRIYNEDTTAPLRTEGAHVIQERNRYQVSGDVINPYKDQLNDAQVIAIAYDGSGNVIGGGTGKVRFVPAEGKAAALVDIRTPSNPARVELFAMLTGAS